MARRANLKKGIKGPMKMKQLGGFGGSGMVQAQADLKKKRQQKEAEAANRAAANASPRAKKQNTPQGSMAKDQKGSFIEPNKELKFGGVKKYKQGGIEDRDRGYGSSLKKDDYAGRVTRPAVSKTMPKKSGKVPTDTAEKMRSNQQSIGKNTETSMSRTTKAVDAAREKWGEGFSSAFAAARKAGKGTFTFKGRTFGTRKKGESQEEYNAAMKRASGRDQKMSTTSSRGPSQIENKKPTASLQATRVTVPKVEEKNRKQKRQERKASKNSTSPMTDRRTKSISKTSSKSGPSKPKPSKSKSEEMGMKKLNKALGRSMKRGGRY